MCNGDSMLFAYNIVLRDTRPVLKIIAHAGAREIEDLSQAVEAAHKVKQTAGKVKSHSKPRRAANLHS